MKQSAFDKINNQVFSLLEKGIVPWKQTWTNELPQNLVSKRNYNGWNFFWLYFEALGKGYTTNYWLTFKQCRDLGGYVKKGEKSSDVFFWKPIEILDKETGKKKKTIILKEYKVFNFSQCDGLKLPEKSEIKRLQGAESVVAAYKDNPEIIYSGSPCYYVTKDKVGMPERNSFKTSEEYYSTLFHELVHSTGHEKRLNRKELMTNTFFGASDYSKEELVAELGAAYLSAHAGISNAVIENQAAYIKSWSKRLQEDKTLLVSACSKAQKSFDYILYGKKQEA